MVNRAALAQASGELAVIGARRGSTRPRGLLAFVQIPERDSCEESSHNYRCAARCHLSAATRSNAAGRQSGQISITVASKLRDERNEFDATTMNDNAKIGTPIWAWAVCSSSSA